MPNDLDKVPGIVLSRGRNWKEQRKFAVSTLRKLIKGSTHIENQTVKVISWFCSNIVNPKHEALDVKSK